MNKHFQFVLFMAFEISVCVVAHEGHQLPGAVPPAPHGGKLQEATHGKHELFYEVVYQSPILKVYPLTLAPKADVFISVSPEKFSKIILKVEIPRKKKMLMAKWHPREDHLEASIDTGGATRFFVHISSSYKGETKSAKIQLEF